MFTIEQISTILSTDRNTAYGLVRFLEAKGVVTSLNEKTGQPGKPRKLYTFTSPAPHAEVNLALLPFFQAVAMLAEERQVAVASALAKLSPQVPADTQMSA